MVTESASVVFAKKNEPSRLTFIPSFLGDESLYSWAARYHLISGNTRSTRSSEDFFEDKRAGIRPDFPFQIANFCKNTRGLLGSPDEILQKRTLFGYFSPFLDLQKRTVLIEQMLGNDTTALKRTLGLLASRVGASHPLKACCHCIKEDLKQYGVSTWKAEHQWPSIWVCRRHACFLCAVGPQIRMKDARQWILPEEVMQKDWHRLKPLRNCIASLIRLAELNVSIVDHFGSEIDPNRLRITYLYGLKTKGLITTDGSIKFQKLRASFVAHYRDIKQIPGFGLLSMVESGHGGLLGLLTRRYQGQRHPLKHLLLISYLFHSGERFKCEYQKAAEDEAAFAMDSGWRAQKFNQEWKTKFHQLVEVDALSVSAAARKLNIPLPQAFRYARAIGIKYEKRLRVLTPELKATFHNLAMRGMSYDEIANSLQIKKSLVRSFMAENKVLRNRWRALRIGSNLTKLT